MITAHESDAYNLNQSATELTLKTKAQFYKYLLKIREKILSHSNKNKSN